MKGQLKEQYARVLNIKKLALTRKDAIFSGLPHYYTGKECKNGHISARNASTGTCCACISKSKEKKGTWKNHENYFSRIN